MFYQFEWSEQNRTSLYQVQHTTMLHSDSIRPFITELVLVGHNKSLSLVMCEQTGGHKQSTIGTSLIAHTMEEVVTFITRYIYRCIVPQYMLI